VLASFNISIDINLEDKLLLLFIEVVAFIRLLFAVVKELVTTVS
jgi:hypothetical protein